jgi:hypothetical protein
MGTVEQYGKRLRALRYSPMRKEAWQPMFVLIGFAFAAMFVFFLVFLLIEAVT